MKSQLKKIYLIPIPKHITLILINEKNHKLFILKYNNVIKAVKLKLNFNLLLLKKRIFLINNLVLKIFEYSLIIQKSIIVSFLKQFIFELNNYKIYKQLKLIGIGFKVYKFMANNSILIFKFGFSHSIYFKLIKNITIKNFHNTQMLFLLSNSLLAILKYSNFIKLLKPIDVYTGKGVFFYNENIHLKKIKHI